MGKVSWRSEKVVTCSFCGGEVRGNLDTSADIICSICVLRLCNTPVERIREAYDRLLAKGNLRRAKLLESFIRGGRSDVRAKSITEKERAINCASRRRVANRVRYERAVRFIGSNGG